MEYQSSVGPGTLVWDLLGFQGIRAVANGFGLPPNPPLYFCPTAGDSPAGRAGPGAAGAGE